MPVASVLTIGTFDIPHIGHANLFIRCQELGMLTVGVNSDEWVKKYKGKAPVFNQEERLGLVTSMGIDAYINDGPGKTLISKVIPDILVIGSDWLGKDYLAQLDVTPKFLEERGIALMYVPYTQGISTTDIIRRLNER